MGCPVVRGEETRPNIVLLVSDDQRPDTIAALGNSHIRTPHLDRLVADGMAFTRAVCPNPLCVPSRAELLTGCSGFRNGILPGYTNRLDESLVTLPQELAAAGYRTWYVGKWHTQGQPQQRGYAATRGLFRGAGLETTIAVDALGVAVTGYRGWGFHDERGRVQRERGGGLTPDISAAFADAAIEVIETAGDEPYFLHVNFTAPHDPLLWPTGYESLYDSAALPLPENYLSHHPFDHGNLGGRDERLWPQERDEQLVRRHLAVYYAVISHMDAQIGRILAALDDAGQRERTIVIFTSDHGLAIGSHGLRGKQNMYEHTIGVPLVMAGPGISASHSSADQAYLRDLYPTICELAGTEVPQTVCAKSFADVLRGEADRHHAAVFGYFRDVQRMVRSERWKLIVYPQVSRAQLFDLAGDPHERVDLMGNPSHAERVVRLRGLLTDWQADGNDPLAAP